MSDHRARSLAAAVGLRTSLLISTLALTAHALFLYGQLVGREDDCPGAGRTHVLVLARLDSARRFISACRSFCVSHTKLARYAPPCASGSRSAAAPPVLATTDRDRLRAGFNNTGCDASVADKSDSMMEIDLSASLGYHAHGLLAAAAGALEASACGTDCPFGDETLPPGAPPACATLECDACTIVAGVAAEQRCAGKLEAAPPPRRAEEPGLRRRGGPHSSRLSMSRCPSRTCPTCTR